MGFFCTAINYLKEQDVRSQEDTKLVIWTQQSHNGKPKKIKIKWSLRQSKTLSLHFHSMNGMLGVKLGVIYNRGTWHQLL